MDIFLAIPQETHRQKVEEYKQKFLASACDGGCFYASISQIPGSSGLGDLDFDSWLKKCQDYSASVNLPDGIVPATQFLVFRKDDQKLIGMVQIRHALTPFLERIGGHIGYSIVPDERGKGYGTYTLKLALDECKKLGIKRVRMTCLNTNKASSKVIENCGGIYDGNAEYDGEYPQFFGKVFSRYWIEV